MNSSNVGYVPIVVESSSDSEGNADPGDSSNSDISQELFTSNVGVMYRYQGQQQRLMDERRAQEHIDFRNKYFTPETSRHSILVETHNHHVTIENHNYVVHFVDSAHNSTGGYGEFDNVIGFRMIKAGVPNRDYHVTDDNKSLTFAFGGSGKNVNLTPGSYALTDFATHLQTTMNSHGDVSGITVTADTITLKFTFSHSSTTIGFDFTDTTTNLHRLLGFERSLVSAAISVTSTVTPDFSNHYIDVVIDEIPYIACKRNARGRHVIDRIAFYSSQGSLNYYENKQLIHQNYFTPIKLSKLSIQLLDDIGNHYKAEQTHMFFEFEITVLNHQA